MQASRGPTVALLAGVVVLALGVRIAVMVQCRSFEIPSTRDHWEFGYETGRIARSLATGQGFSSPMPEPSGPTSFLLPGYPLVLAGIFRAWGVYTTQSAIAAYVLNCLLSALTCILLYRLGERLFGRTTGLVAAVLLALYPPSIWHAVNSIWDTTLLALALVVLVNRIAGLPPRPAPAQMAATGLLMGMIALLNPAPISFYPAVALVLWKRLRDQGATGYREIAILTGCCLLVLAPWMARNQLLMGTCAPRSGIGVNLRLGNNDSAFRSASAEDLSIYPSNLESEDRLFHQLGEIGYDRYCARLGMDYIRDDPQRFAALTMTRVRIWWLGRGSEWRGNLKLAFRVSALKRFLWMLPLPFFLLGCAAAWRNHARIGLLMGLILMYPIPYYFLIVGERYHFPVEPFLLLVGSYGLTQAGEWLGRRGHRRRVTGDVLVDLPG